MTSPTTLGLRSMPSSTLSFGGKIWNRPSTTCRQFVSVSLSSSLFKRKRRTPENSG
eukprot:CAMPEP_0198269058 /NCGR_PEP_ID=MMETSP1447-20131203/39830_1 /TAXON_ID=420782 /ORGANISM="Chaetoceros dichaeta, Strain CCMP1751" /LENGTH=55 /DNA_ID=CAMNT_0043960449 /DNA_START=14 /DNA_END=177 /DNA_ORIENTATION=-